MKHKLPKIQIRKTKKYGNAVFAKEDIAKGKVIHIFSGEVITFDECIERIRAGTEAQTDTLQVGLELDMDLDEISRSFNHACEPNAGLRKISEMVAIRDIKTGEEITYDYSATIGPNIPKSLWTMDCLCEAKKCRKVISNVLTIPREQLKKYISADGVQEYIKRELEIIKLCGGKLPRYKKIKI